MILYAEDIVRNRPHVHWDTKNASAIRMAIVFKRMGIKNYYFHLTLYQPELANVDPFDYKNLDDETIAKILTECKLNPWYFFREVIRIPSSGGDPIPFEFHRANIAAIWTFFNDIDFGLIQPRQTGKTFVTQSLVCLIMYVLADHLDIGMFTKDSTLLQDNVKRLKELRDSLPVYFIQKSTRDSDRKEGLTYAAKTNAYKTFTAANDERGAYKLGRGATMALIHFDEIAFMNYNWIVVPTAINAMLKASEQARARGIPSPIIYTTTAGNPDTKEGSFALSILESALAFSESFYDLPNRKELVSLIDRSAGSRMLFLEFSYRQLGKTDEWFKQAAARSKSSQDDINRDLLNIWQSSTDKAVIPQHIITKLRESRREPTFTDLSDGFVVRWYLDREIVATNEFKNRVLFMGMDTSENVGRDFTTFVIIDPRDMKVVATCRCNESNTMQVAKHVVTFLMRYSRLVYIPERNNTGVGIIDFVIENLQELGVNPFTRIYNEVVQNINDTKYKNVNIHNYREIYGTIRSAFGFRTSGGAATSGTSRNLLYKVTMMKTLEMNNSRIYDSNLINEFCQLTEKNGRIDHPDGCHDDTVIAYLLACYLVYFGRNLHIYGVPNGTVLETLSTTGDIVSVTKKDEQIAIRRRISELEELVSRNSTHILRQSYMRELENLRPLLDEKVVSVQPVAVSQVEYQKQEISNSIGGSTINRMRAFTNRFLNM